MSKLTELQARIPAEDYRRWLGTMIRFHTTCPTCSAETGMPCLDATKHMNRWTFHRERHNEFKRMYNNGEIKGLAAEIPRRAAQKRWNAPKAKVSRPDVHSGHLRTGLPAKDGSG